MKQYKAYKESNIEWVGRIPEHWETRRLKYVAYSNPSNIDKKSNDDEESVLLCNYLDVYKNEFITSAISFMEATASTLQISKFLLKKGDVIATKDSESPDDIAIAALVMEDFNNVVCGYHLNHIRPFDIEGSYLFRLFQCSFMRSYFEVAANGVTRFGIGAEKFDNVEVILPPRTDQILIAAYLDRKTTEIDSVIADKKRLLKLFEEEKTAIINQAVTKGINSKTKMKDSGIEWLGKIPEHWEVKKLKWVHQTTSGGTPKTGDSGNYDGDIPWLRTLDLNNDKVVECELLITEKALKESSARIVPINSVLLAMYGGAGTIGKSGLLKFEAAINQAICAILPNGRTSPEYLHFFIKFFRPYWMVGAEGTRRDPNIGQDDIRNKEFAFPPIEEQQSIVRHIETECAFIDTKIAKTKKLIELLSEYRTALISEVVTGKIKVTD